MSLMKRHQQNCGTVLGSMPDSSPAVAVVLPAATGLMAGQQLADLLSASLAEDVKSLKGVSSHERKADMKRDIFIPKYRTYVQRLMADGVQHDVQGWQLVWLMDSGMVEEAQGLARHCVTTGQKLPENFKAAPGYFYADTLLNWAEGELTAGRSFEPYVSDLLTDVLAAPEGWNVPDTLVGKIHRLRGIAAEKAEDYATASAELTRALELGAQVKTALAAVNKKLGKE